MAANEAKRRSSIPEVRWYLVNVSGNRSSRLLDPERRARLETALIERGVRWFVITPIDPE